MKKLVVIILMFYSFKIGAQSNLVINPSFETHTACPSNTGGDVDKAIGWDTCRSTADYFNSCATSSFFKVPKNLLGFQYPAHGNAYGGFYTYDVGSFYREIIIGKLSAPLTVSQKYFFSFKVSRADSNTYVGYSTDKMGVKFTKVKQTYVPINNTAHYYSNTVIADTINWTKVSGSFVVDSAYEYIMIGNFFDDANTTIVNHGNGFWAYYYIDEICVSTDSVFTENYATGLIQLSMQSELKIFPNPANEFFNVNGMFEEEIIIVNLFGEEIFRSKGINKSIFSVDCSDWRPGIYLIKIKNRTFKLIKNPK